MKILCKTKFDITPTGVTGHFRPSRGMFNDAANQEIKDVTTWNRSRNQQRNWETLTQLIGLRTQVDFTLPERKGSEWIFTFETDNHTVFADAISTLGQLEQDCEGVPMLINLTEQAGLDPVLSVNGDRSNIVFKEIPVNN